MLKLNAEALRDYKPTSLELASIKRHPIYIICDNILDTYNVGAIFRLADAASVSGVYLVGETATPTDPKLGHKIHKSSVGVWQWVPWQYANTITESIEDIKNVVAGFVPDNNKAATVTDIKYQKSKNVVAASYAAFDLQIIAVEQHPKSIPYDKADYQLPLVLILGHETTGVSKEGLTLADQIVEIPMFGVNKSMNVMVSLGIVLWQVLSQVRRNK